MYDWWSTDAMLKGHLEFMAREGVPSLCCWRGMTVFVMRWKDLHSFDFVVAEFPGFVRHSFCSLASCIVGCFSLHVALHQVTC